jgi:hypothetical protein
VIQGRAFGLFEDASGQVDKREQPFLAIPYATWANRGRGQMAVWLARTDSAARPAPYPTLATTSTVIASPPPTGRGRNPGNVIDGDEPISSADPSQYFDWWPVQGSRLEWIEMTFARASTVSESAVYWFDDTGRGGVRVPASWRLLYRAEDGWRPVETTGVYGTARDAWNRVTFAPQATTGLRIEVVMQPGFSAGIQEWKVK